MAVITGYTGSDTAVIIPSEINGYPVTSIDSYAFYGLNTLTEITFPVTITSIAEDAFNECDSLSTVNYKGTAEQMRSISIDSFGNNAILNNSWHCSDDVINPYFTYRLLNNDAYITGYTGTESYINVPNRIDGYPVKGFAFEQTASATKELIESVRIAEGIELIADNAFSGFINLSNINFPESLYAIGNNAFNGCSKLSYITIPESITVIGTNAFADCGQDNGTILRVIKDSYAHQYASSNNLNCRTYITYPASSTYPESSYPHNANVQTWTYTHPTEATHLRITFSDDSVLAEGEELVFGDSEEDSFTAFIEHKRYLGSQLSGLVVAVPAGEQQFQIRLYSNENNSASSFRITDVTPITNEEYWMPRFQVSNGVITAVDPGPYNADDMEDALVVPETINGQTITGIGPHAFDSYIYGHSIQLPDTITTIGDHAFSGCAFLTSITLPRNLKTIGSHAFEWTCLNSALVLPDGVETVGSYAFANIEGLTSITIPESVTSIGEHAFDPSEWAEEPVTLRVVEGSYAHQYAQENNIDFVLIVLSEFSFEVEDDKAIITGYTGSGTEISIPNEIGGYPVIGIADMGGSPIDHSPARNLTHITVPEGVIYLGDNSFDYCTSLVSIDLPDSLTTIGTWAFSGCWNLTSITIPKGVSSIGTNVFDECSNLASITTDSNNIHFTSVDGILYNNDLTTVIACPSAKIGSLALPSTITVIADSAFYGSHLTHISVPDGVTAIGNWAFYCCQIAELNLPDTVNTIGSNAFGSCYNLTSITIPNGIASIGRGTFEFCENLSSITFPASLTSIGDAAFNGCTKLSSVTYRGNCADVPNITIGDTNGILLVATWNCADGDYVFSASGACGDQLTWTFGNHTLTITGAGTMNDYVWDAWAPWNQYASGITAVIVENGVTSIGDRAFYQFDTMTSVSLPVSVTSIGEEAFLGCSSLSSIQLPTSLEYIGEHAFEHSGLTSISIPASVTNIGNNAFYNTYGLQSIEVSTQNQFYASIDGVLYDKTLTTLLRCPETKSGDFIVPDSVTTIPDGAFYYCFGLDSVTVPEHVTDIGDDAFEGSRDTLLSLTLKVHDNSYAMQYAIDNGMNYELIDVPAVQMILQDEKTQTIIENGRIDRTYYGVNDYYMECIPVASIANYTELKASRETEPECSYEQLSGPEYEIDFATEGNYIEMHLEIFDVENDPPADIVYRFTYTWDDLDPVAFDLNIHLKKPAMGEPEGIAISPQYIDVTAGETFTITASWLPEGWGIEGVATTMDYELIDWWNYEEDVLKDVTISGTTFSAMIETPGYYKLSLRLYASIMNWPNTAYITVRNSDGSLPGLVPELSATPEELYGTAGTAKNPQYPYDDVSGNMVGYLGIRNYQFFAQHGKSFSLDIEKVENDAPELTAVWESENAPWYNIYVGEPDTIIPASSVGHWHYVITLRWGDESMTFNSTLTVKPEPIVFKLPTHLTSIEEEAFVGVQADVFVIPAGVTSISPSAFDSGVRLSVVEGSYAERFADENGFEIEYQ